MELNDTMDTNLSPGLCTRPPFAGPQFPSDLPYRDDEQVCLQSFGQFFTLLSLALQDCRWPPVLPSNLLLVQIPCPCRPHMGATTCAHGSLGRTKVIMDFGCFYPAKWILQSPLVEDAAPSRQMQGMATITSFRRVCYGEVLTISAIELFSYTYSAIPHSHWCKARRLLSTPRSARPAQWSIRHLQYPNYGHRVHSSGHTTCPSWSYISRRPLLAPGSSVAGEQ
jgi:hypothetical protein